MDICIDRINLEKLPPQKTGSSHLKQQRRQRLQTRHLKREFALLQTLSHFFNLVEFEKQWKIFFLELNFKGLYRRSGKEKECPVFVSRQNVKIERFML